MRTLHQSLSLSLPKESHLVDRNSLAMSEVSQETSPNEETTSSARARRKEQMSGKKRPVNASTSTAPRDGAELLCDTWQLTNKQRLLTGFLGLGFLVPYTTMSLTHPEWTGHVGTRLSQAFFSFFGQAASLTPILLAYFILSCAGLRPLRKTRYLFGLPLLVSLVLLFERAARAGGWLGRSLDWMLTTSVGPAGAWLFTSIAVVLLALAFFPRVWGETTQSLELAAEYARDTFLRWKESLQAEPSVETGTLSAATPIALPEAQPSQQSPPSTRALPAHHPFLSMDETYPEDSYEETTAELQSAATAQLEPVDFEPSFEDTEDVEYVSYEAELPSPPEPPLLRFEETPMPTPTAEPREQAPVNTKLETPLQPAAPARAEVLKAAEEQVDDPRAAVPRARPFELPPLALLDDVPQAERRPRVEDKSQALLDALDAFGVKAKLLQIVRGPTVTRYELLPARGVKVSKFTSLTNDIALALASTAVRIEAPIPGKSAIGIEIPNEITDLVVIKDILRDTTFTDSKGLTVALGKDLSGRPVVTDLQKMPHLLVAGTTGSGKSVCVNGLILSLLYRFTPDQLQLMMVDPKQVELSVYEDIPHLVGFSEGGKGEIIVDPKKAAQALHQVVELMEQRYTLFAECRVRNLAEYNNKAEAPLPWFVVIIDELADLMMVASKSVETSICRIAQKARAAGIHLVLATQRPSADVITGLIKVNIPSRAAFAVSSQVDSRVILDSGGAEHLLGKGDMLFLPVDASDPKRLQGAYVNNDEISRVVEFWKGQHLPENRIEFELKEDPLALDDEEPEEGSDDALLEEALRVILQRDQASASMLQTDLKVGYARARRLLMAMEKKGWVSPAEGSKPRKILYTGAPIDSGSQSAD